MRLALALVSIALHVAGYIGFVGHSWMTTLRRFRLTSGGRPLLTALLSAKRALLAVGF